MTRSGQIAEDKASCARCLYVNLDFLRIEPPPADNGEECWNGWEEDMALAGAPEVDAIEEGYLRKWSPRSTSGSRPSPYNRRP